MNPQRFKLRYISPHSVKDDGDAFYDIEKLGELAESIRQFGVAVPIAVVSRFCGYRLVSGGRRLAAAKQTGVDKIPALVIKKERDVPLFAVLCDLHREPPNEFVTARAIHRLSESEGTGLEELCAMIGISEELARSYKRLLELSPERQRICEAAMCGRDYSDRIAALPESEKEKLFLGLLDESRPLEERAAALRERIGCKGTAVPRRAVAIKDVRIFLNTIDRAVDVMQSSGVKAATERHDYEDFTEYLIRIPLEGARRPANTLTATST